MPWIEMHAGGAASAAAAVGHWYCWRLPSNWWISQWEGLANHSGALAFNIYRCLVGKGNFSKGWVAAGCNIPLCLSMEGFCSTHTVSNNGTLWALSCLALIIALPMPASKIRTLSTAAAVSSSVSRSSCRQSKASAAVAITWQLPSWPWLPFFSHLQGNLNTDCFL